MVRLFQTHSAGNVLPQCDIHATSTAGEGAPATFERGKIEVHSSIFRFGFVPGSGGAA